MKPVGLAVIARITRVIVASRPGMNRVVQVIIAALTRAILPAPILAHARATGPTITHADAPTATLCSPAQHSVDSQYSKDGKAPTPARPVHIVTSLIREKLAADIVERTRAFSAT
jgi:hypothetical protein